MYEEQIQLIKVLHPRYIRCLPLESWQKMVWEGLWGEPCDLNSLATNLTKIEPILHRKGYFCMRKGVLTEAFAWFENGEEAYTTPTLASSFNYDLKIDGHVPLHPDVRKAIACLIREHLATRRQINLYHTDYEWWHLHVIRRGVELRFNHRTQDIRMQSREAYSREWHNKYDAKN